MLAPTWRDEEKRAAPPRWLVHTDFGELGKREPLHIEEILHAAGVCRDGRHASPAREAAAMSCVTL